MSIHTLSRNHSSVPSGVLQGPFGSLVREGSGINDSDPAELYSEHGRTALRRALRAYRDADATIGGAPTYRLTHLRPRRTDVDAWHHAPSRHFRLRAEYADWNDEAVRIAREVYGEQALIFGLLASIPDSSGGHDAQWQSLGGHQKDFVRRRHEPQITVLRDAGIEHFLLEAGRYVPEAEALALLLAETGAKTLGFSFEAPQGRVPDPAFPDLRFADVRERLYDAAKGKLSVLTGINCVDPAAVRVALEHDDLPQIVYPNKPQDYDPSPEEYRRLFHDCLEQRAKIIGVCCGGRPEQIKIARRVFDQWPAL